MKLSLQSNDVAAYEKELILRSLSQTVIPTLVSEDLDLFAGLVKDVFETSQLAVTDADELIAAAKTICEKKHLIATQPLLEVLLYYYYSYYYGFLELIFI